jgi:hypothetical protein
MEDISAFISTYPKGKLCIIECNDQNDRKIIHQYLETSHPNIHKTSIYCECFPSKQKMFMEHCGNLVELAYNIGIDKENIIRSSYSGICKLCDEPLCCDPNYDEYDRLIQIQQNNAIVIGDYITQNHETPKEQIHIPDEIFLEIIKKYKVHQIDAPKEGFLFLPEKPGKKGKSKLNKRKNRLGEFVSSCIHNIT